MVSHLQIYLQSNLATSTNSSPLQSNGSQKHRGRNAALSSELLLRGHDRFDLDRLCVRVERACHGHFLPRKLHWRFLIAQRVGGRAVGDDEESAVRIDAGKSAFRIRGSHLHKGMVSLSAHAVGDGAGEGSLGLHRLHSCQDEAENEKPHEVSSGRVP